MTDPKNQTRQAKFRVSLRERGGISTGVNLSPSANASLLASMRAEGASRSSIINKALIAYQEKHHDEKIRPSEA